MTSQGAEKAITTSALLVAGIYIYRRLTEGSGTATGSKTAQLLGQGSPPSVGTFITAWGAAYLIMAIMATASPGLGGGFAILAATGDVLSNGQQVASDINTKVSASSSVSSASVGTTTAAGTTPKAVYQPGVNSLSPTPPAGVTLLP